MQAVRAHLTPVVLMGEELETEWGGKKGETGKAGWGVVERLVTASVAVTQRKLLFWKRDAVNVPATTRRAGRC